jgi:general secretion pathway protein A
VLRDGRYSTRIGVKEVRAAIDELGWVEFAARTSRFRQQAGETPPPAAAVVGPVARIIVAHDGQKIGERELFPGRLIIGRTAENDLQIDSKYVSRHHCQILTTPEGSVLEDLNSTNGVYIKSKRVRKRHLNDGDVIVLGRHEIMYLDERGGRGAQPQDEPADEAPAAAGDESSSRDAATGTYGEQG